MKITFDERLACVVGIDAAIVAEFLHRKRLEQPNSILGNPIIVIPSIEQYHYFLFWKAIAFECAIQELKRFGLVEDISSNNETFSVRLTDLFFKYYY